MELYKICLVFSELFLITVLQILPKDTVPVVKGTYRHEEEGEVVAVSNINIYSSCKRSACYNKKLNNNVCPKCNTKYPDGEEEHAIICSIGIQQNNDLSMVTLFTPQVKTLMRQTDAIEQKDSSRIEKELLDALPVKIGFTRSPVKDTNTLAKLKRL